MHLNGITTTGLDQKDMHLTNNPSCYKKIKEIFSYSSTVNTQNYIRKFIINGCNDVHTIDKKPIKILNNKIRTAKYAWYTFLPKNLAEQFTNMANVYFIIMMCLSLIKAISISQGIPNLLPSILIIFTFTAIKDLLEDRKRAKVDDDENNRLVEVYNNSITNYKSCKWQKIKVGDMIKVKKNEPLPCDMILLYAHGYQGKCYVETKNLDGETNLQTKDGLCKAETCINLVENQSDQVNANRCCGLVLDVLNGAVVTCNSPNPYLYQFEGLIEYDNEVFGNGKLPVGYNNFLLRGSSLKRNEYIIGVCVYTGHENKIMLNSKKSKAKFSNVQRITGFRVIQLFLLQLILSFFIALYGAIWIYHMHLYESFSSSFNGINSKFGENLLLGFGTWNLITAQVPISIVINLEFVRIFETLFLQKDTKFHFKELVKLNTETNKNEPINEDNKKDSKAMNVSEDLVIDDNIDNAKAMNLNHNTSQSLKSPKSIQYDSNHKFRRKKIFPQEDSIGKPNQIKDSNRLEDDLPSQSKTKGDIGLHQSVASNPSDYEASYPFSPGEAEKEDQPISMNNLASLLSSIKESSPSNTNIVVNNSKVLEDLGQIQHIFTDKTGTLTMNKMVLKEISINGKIYKDTIRETKYDQENIDLAFLLLNTCHSVVIDDNGNYSATSPDDLALITYTKRCKYEYLGSKDNNHIITISKNGYMMNVERKHIMEFSSERRKMSTIIKTMDDRYIIFSKGADDAIFNKLCNKTNDLNIINTANEHLQSFAMKGYRTLALSYKYMEYDEYIAFCKEIEKANQLLEGRENKRGELFDNLENNMRLLGITGVEDKLQIGLNASLDFIHKSKQKLWVITGDKLETSINIATSCGILNDKTQQLIINTNDKEMIIQIINQYYKQIQDKNQIKDYVLIFTGVTLALLQDNMVYLTKLIKIGCNCKSVLVCRSTPKQKADIVRLFRKIQPNKITLAVGDGANDVSMIISAHVGVGIRGHEGAQAARAADFSIGEFRDLMPLIFGHGREIYIKNTNLLNYIFYRNTIIVASTIYWGPLTGQSGVSVAPHYYVGPFYQLLYTSATITSYAIFDSEYSINTLLSNPKFYLMIRNNTMYNLKSFLKWQLNGAYQGACIFLIAFIGVIYGDSGRILCINFQRTILLFCAIIIANTTVIIIANKITMLLAGAFAVGIGFYILLLYLASLLDSFELSYIIKHLWNIPECYIGCILCSIVGCIPYMAFQRYIKLIMK